MRSASSSRSPPLALPRRCCSSAISAPPPCATWVCTIRCSWPRIWIPPSGTPMRMPISRTPPQCRMSPCWAAVMATPTSIPSRSPRTCCAAPRPPVRPPVSGSLSISTAAMRWAIRCCGSARSISMSWWRRSIRPSRPCPSAWRSRPSSTIPIPAAPGTTTPLSAPTSRSPAPTSSRSPPPILTAWTAYQRAWTTSCMCRSRSIRRMPSCSRRHRWPSRRAPTTVASRSRWAPMVATISSPSSTPRSAMARSVWAAATASIQTRRMCASPAAAITATTPTASWPRPRRPHWCRSRWYRSAACRARLTTAPPISRPTPSIQKRDSG